jgi:hypothetical protein
MTPEDQARLLAGWLERHPGEDPPADLEPEVVEAVYALRPDLAPAPRVTADDILAEVTAGPLVPGWVPDLTEDEPTPPAEVVPFPSEVERAAAVAGPAQPAPAARPRRWGRWVAGTTVGTALAMAAAALLFVQFSMFSGDEAAPMATLESSRDEVATIPEVVAPEPARGIADADEPAVALLDTGGSAEKLASAQHRLSTRSTSGPSVANNAEYFDQTVARPTEPTTPKARPKVAATPPPRDYDAVADGYEEFEFDGEGILGAETAGAAGRSAEGAGGWGVEQPVGGVAGVSTSTMSESAHTDLLKKDMEEIRSDDQVVTVAGAREVAPVGAPDRDQNEAVAAVDRVRGDQAPAATPPPAPAPVETPVYQDYGTVADVGDYEEDEEVEDAVTPTSEEVVLMERKGPPRIRLGRKRESSRRAGKAKDADASEEEVPPEVTVSAEPVPIPELEPVDEEEPEPEPASDVPEPEPVAEAAPKPEPEELFEIGFGRDRPLKGMTDARLDRLRTEAIPSEFSEEALMLWAPAPPAANAEASELAKEGEYLRAADALQTMLDNPAPEGQFYAAQSANYRLQAGDVEQANEDVLRGLAISDANTPERAWLLVLKGDALRARGKYDRAAQAYQQAIALNLGRANQPVRARPAQEP